MYKQAMHITNMLFLLYQQIMNNQVIKTC